MRHSKNEFIYKETRKLHEPVILETDLSDFNYDSFLINFNKIRISNGYKLTPEEEFENIGVELNLNNMNIDSITDKTKIDDKTGKLKEPILYHYLLSKQRKKNLTPDEQVKLTEIEVRTVIRKSTIIKDEIKQSLNNWKQLVAYKPQLELITKHLIDFRSKRYTHGKFPIWIDLERFVHILLRHVAETNIGEGFKDKSKFQYVIDNIHLLIETVLKSVDSEIQKHFQYSSDKPFKRHGKMSVYYNGDYYVIHIDNTGRLMTFYKTK